MTKLNDNLIPLLIAVVIGLIFGLSHVLIPILQGADIEYLPFIQGDENVYAQFIKESYEAKPLSDPQLFEYKDRFSFAFSPFPAIVLSQLTHLTGSVTNTFIVCDFILPPISFLLIYFFLFKLTNRKDISILGGVLVLLSRTIYLLFSIILVTLFPLLTKTPISNITSQFINTTYPSQTLYRFARLYSIQFNFIILILAIISLYLAIRTNKKIYSITTGIFTGLLFYTYFFYWTFFIVGFGLLFLIFLLKNVKKSHYKKLKQLFIIFVVTAIVSIPFWISLILMPVSRDVLKRNGSLTYGRFFDIKETPIYIIFLILFTVLIKEKKDSFYLLFAFFLGGLICINIQLILGYTLPHRHWIICAIHPLMSIMTAYLIYRISNTRYNNKYMKCLSFNVKKYCHLLCVLIIVFLLVHATYRQIIFSLNRYQDMTMPKNYRNAYAWLNENTEMDDVVLSFDTTNMHYIPVHTNNNNFIPISYTTVAPTSEILERYYIGYKLLNTSPSDTEWYDAFGFEYYNFDYSCDSCGLTPIGEGVMEDGELIPVEMIEIKQELLDRYTTNTESIDDLISKYRLDYIYYGPYEMEISNVNLSDHKQFSEVYRNEDVVIYKIIKKI